MEELIALTVALLVLELLLPIEVELEGVVRTVATSRRVVPELLERAEVEVFVVEVVLPEVLPAIEVKGVNEETLLMPFLLEVEVELEPLEEMLFAFALQEQTQGAEVKVNAVV